MTDYNSFKESIMNSFDDIMGNSSDVESFEQATSELSISVLKKFHIYWNSLREDGKMPKSLEDTNQILRTLNLEYKRKQSFLYHVTQIILNKIKEAYIRFLTAHNSVEFLRNNLLFVIADKIIERFENSCNEIKFSRFDMTRYLHEIATILDLHDAFDVVAYRLGYSQQLTLNLYRMNIFQRIVEVFNGISQQLSHESAYQRVEMKQFTAILLLKMEHHNFLIFFFHSVSEIASLPQANILSEHRTTVKVYYELRDYLVIIPKHCVNFLEIKVCAIYETNKIIRYLSGKYLLKRSISGWGVFDYMTDLLRDLYSKTNDLIWNNFTLFKNYFFQNTFALLINFKQFFLIKNDSCIEELEEKLGTAINEFRKDFTIKDTNFGLVDQLDLDLYEKMLIIKSEKNILVPYNRDPEILTNITNDLFNFLFGFHEKYIKDMNDGFRLLLINIAFQIKQWKKESLSAPNEVFEITEHPLNMANPYPQIFHKYEESDTNKAILGKSVKNYHDQLTELPSEKISDDENREFKKIMNAPLDLTPLPMHNSYFSTITTDRDNGSGTGFLSGDGTFSPGGD